MIGETINWDKESVRSLRLRLGWSRCDLARRLHCSSEEIEMWEEGKCEIHMSFFSPLELIFRQAQVCCDEVKLVPVAENECEKMALEQIDFSRVKVDFE
ncbi:MAG: helix-turn-helix domain-containing protein [Pseudobdellovibrionaceae bacterium]